MMTEPTQDLNQIAPVAKDKRKPSMLTIGTLILVIVALLTLAWQWLNTRHKFSEVEQSLSHKLDEYQALNQQSLALAKQAEERSMQANARTIILEQKVAESRDQQEVLQTLYNQIAENRESTAVAEVEQLLTIANQQLQLAGNIKSALLALESAQKRLQPIDLPRATQLSDTLALEIENLRKLPQVDIINMSAQLTKLSELCSILPLISERQPILDANTKQKESRGTQQGALQKFKMEVWDDIKKMISVERIDKPEPPLLAADHAFYLRENLKLRLLTARIALLQRDEATYKTDLETVSAWLNQYFDTTHANTINALNIVKKLSSNNINLELPQLADSFAAVNRYKLSLEKSD